MNFWDLEKKWSCNENCGPILKNTIRDGDSTAQIIGFLGLIIEILKSNKICQFNQMQFYTSHHAVDIVMVVFQ